MKDILKVIDCNDACAPWDFVESLRSTGFAVLKNHGLSDYLVEQSYKDWYHFFKSEDKEHFKLDKETQAGYINMFQSETAKGCTVRDLKEFYHYYYDSKVPYGLEFLTKALYVDLYKLASKLLKWVEWGTPDEISRTFSEPLSEMISGSNRTLLRIIHYPPLKEIKEKGAVRAAAHEDINLLTVLPASTAKGLEVLYSSGEWLKVPVEKDWVVVNTGEMLSECTQGYYKATTHRVVNPEGDLADKSRLSIPLFLHPREDVKLSEKYTSGEYLEERLKDLGLK